MVRTIKVTFDSTNGYGSHNPCKSYAFLCKYDEVKVGDLITDLRYTGPMRVVDITYCTSRVQDGYTLKDIIIETINGRKINKPNNDARTISITIEQAREWYESGNRALETLALSVYTQEELELNYKLIEPKVQRNCTCIYFPSDDVEKFKTAAKLATMAKYYNKSWKRTTSNTGYFIGGYNVCGKPLREVTKGIGIYRHDSVVYAGIIYFKTEEDAVKAAKMLGDELKNLF